MTDFGDELRRLLAERGISLRGAARLAECSAGYLSNVAAGRKPLTPSLANRLDRALGTGNTLTARTLHPSRESPGMPKVELGRQGLEQAPLPGAAQAVAANADLEPSSLLPEATAHAELAGAALHARWPAVRLSRVFPSYGTDWNLELPPGRLLDGSGQLVVRVQPLMMAADSEAFVPIGDLRLGALRTVRHGMLIGVDEQADSGTPRLRGLDLRGVRREISRTCDIPSVVAIPQACELDDLCYAIIWVVAGIDDALLADDSALDERHRELRAYERLPESTVSSQAAAGLTSTARMWLGSSFCARHILRNLAKPAGPPVFWTREQTGEEACTWLLFRHKYDYLKRISSMFGGSEDQPLIRGFCIPEPGAMALPLWERILLLLAVALMESLGIWVKICTDPDYADTDGFVLPPGDRAVIATWVRAQGIWYADITSNPPDLRDFSEITGHINAHSVTEAATPAHWETSWAGLG